MSIISPARRSELLLSLAGAVTLAVMMSATFTRAQTPTNSPAYTQGFKKLPLADERILLRTTRGDLVLALYPELAPVHVKQVLHLARLGVYDSTWFYRVEPNFVAQLTDAQNRRTPMTDAQKAALRPLPAEFSNTVTHRRGSLSMARQDADVNSAESSFSIMLAAAPHLDGKYTIFGELEWGEDVLEAIAQARRDSKNAPLVPIVVEQASVISGAELQRMRAEKLLRGPLSVVEPEPAPEPPRSQTHTLAVGIMIMMVLSIVGFLTAGRWKPHRVAAFNLLIVLVGAFLLLSSFVPRAKDDEILGIVLFFGIVALFKLMNRFESQRPSKPPDRA